MTNLQIIAVSLFVLWVVWISLELIFAPEVDENERPIKMKQKKFKNQTEAICFVMDNGGDSKIAMYNLEHAGFYEFKKWHIVIARPQTRRFKPLNLFQA